MTWLFWTYTAAGAFVALSPNRWDRYVVPLARIGALHTCCTVGLLLVMALTRWQGSVPSLIGQFLLLLLFGSAGYFYACLAPEALTDLRTALTTDLGRVALPPGYWLRRLAEPTFHSQTYERVFEPLIADLEHEHAEALSKGQTWRARWIVVRSYVDFALTAVAHVASRVREAFKDVNRAA